MTQSSGIWTTSATPSGHQVSEYTQVLASRMFRIISACHGYQGVGPSSHLNTLACTDGGANTVAVDTGVAIVDGKWYENDASVNVNIPSAVGGGNTRIDRIVLRADWASFQVTIFRIAGTDAGSPSAPAITQTSGTTYDIQLCQVLVDTSGNVTVTDERTFARISTAEMDDDAVTNAKIAASAVTTAKIGDEAVTNAKVLANTLAYNRIAQIGALRIPGNPTNATADIVNITTTPGSDAVLRESGSALGFGEVATAGIANDAVDDTKAGNRVPQFYRRQGGSATNWRTPGTTNYTPGAVRMQAGAATVSIANGNYSGTLAVTFTLAFSDVPLVVVGLQMFSPADTVLYQANAVSATASSVTLLVARNINTPAQSIDVVWFAVGAE